WPLRLVKRGCTGRALSPYQRARMCPEEAHCRLLNASCPSGGPLRLENEKMRVPPGPVMDAEKR
ncbi:MAG: hypothetical protein R3247_14960, partial [Rhodothermales bacterium]|nr:hypothetical protein [Rhodothermales bacterium]